MSNINISKNDLGKYVILKNNVKGKITVFDDSKMPVFVKHDENSSFITNGTWHYTDGTYSNRNMQEYDIIAFVESNKNINKEINNCNHDWEYYLGLQQGFYYCKICDKKKEII